MVALTKTINVGEEANSGGSNVLIPEGNYKAVIIESEMKDTSTGGQMVVFKFVITEGPQANTELVERVNIINQNPEAERIGRSQIANMGKALGLDTVSDTTQLHNKPLVIGIKNSKSNDWTNKDGELVEGKERSEIKKYMPVPASGEVVAAAPAQAPAKQESTVPQATWAAS